MALLVERAEGLLLYVHYTAELLQEKGDGGDGGYDVKHDDGTREAAVPREKLERCDFFYLKWRLQYKCGASGCKARGNCDELFAPNWPTCRCAATVTESGIPRNAAAVTSNGTGARVGELFYSCRHRPSCEHFCGVGRNALANSGLPAAARGAAEQTRPR